MQTSLAYYIRNIKQIWLVNKHFTNTTYGSEMRMKVTGIRSFKTSDL